ncbi:MAG: hypothetical protein COA77_02510 [Thaumarchaeota archaeon]|nr:MAG: hypothetical protein COA77_02510 [Nitrososphaerota archaeon]
MGIDPKQIAKEITDGNSDPHFIGVRTVESAKQKIISFKQHYDQGTVSNLYRDNITEYLKELELVNQLAEKFKLEKIENLAFDLLTKVYLKLIRKNQRYRNEDWLKKFQEIHSQLRMIPTDRKSHIISRAEKLKTTGGRI